MLAVVWFLRHIFVGVATEGSGPTLQQYMEGTSSMDKVEKFLECINSLRLTPNSIDDTFKHCPTARRNHNQMSNLGMEFGLK